MTHCKKCGATDRNASGNCKPCARDSTATWRAANLERERARRAAWYAANRSKAKASAAKWRAANPNYGAEYRAANREKARASAAKWYADNPDKEKSRKEKWRKANPEACRIYNHSRRASKREAGGNLSKDIAEKLFKLQRGKCACGCKQRLGDNFHRDHIMPLALGGTNTDDNIQLLRQRCNNQKHAKHPVDFMQQRGFLI